MFKKVMKAWKKIGMDYFWGDLFDVRFFVINLIRKDNVGITLDLGCGVGMISHFANSKLKVGLELQEKSIKNAKILNPEMELIIGDIRYLPFKKMYFQKFFPFIRFHQCLLLNKEK